MIWDRLAEPWRAAIEEAWEEAVEAGERLFTGGELHALAGTGAGSAAALELLDRSVRPAAATLSQ